MNKVSDLNEILCIWKHIVRDQKSEYAVLCTRITVQPHLCLPKFDHMTKN